MGALTSLPTGKVTRMTTALTDEHGKEIPPGRGPWHSAEPPYGDLVLANRDAGNHWFEPDTMRFFRTRICDGGMVHAGRFFVTSEKNSGMGYDYPRLYTVRVGHDDGTIGTMGDFQQYASRTVAIAAAKRYAAQLMELADA